MENIRNILQPIKRDDHHSYLRRFMESNFLDVLKATIEQKILGPFKKLEVRRERSRGTIETLFAEKVSKVMVISFIVKALDLQCFFRFYVRASVLDFR